MKTEEFIEKINSLPTLKAKRLFYLEDVINHYNSGNRAVDQGKVCVYHPIAGKSEGCAIGRRVPTHVLSQYEGQSVRAAFGKRALPRWMTPLGVDFLSVIQRLHDGEQNWNEQGLSPTGKDYAGFITKQYA